MSFFIWPGQRKGRRNAVPSDIADIGSDNALFLQSCKLSCIYAVAAVDIGIVLAELGSCPLKLGHVIHELDGVAVELDVTGDGVVAVEEHLACLCNVVVIHNGLNVVDRSSGNAGAENEVDCLLDGVVLGPILDDLLELCLMLKAGCGPPPSSPVRLIRPLIA